MLQNFADAVRSRKREPLNAEVEEGAAPTVLVHLANISYRAGRTIYFDPENHHGRRGSGEDDDAGLSEGFVVPEKV